MASRPLVLSLPNVATRAVWFPGNSCHLSNRMSLKTLETLPCAVAEFHQAGGNWPDLGPWERGISI